MKTKWISMLLACIMLVSFAACSNDNDKPDSTPEESTKETDVQTTEDVTTENETTEPEETGWQGPGKNPNMEYCRHGIACEFDDTTMTLTNAYKGNRVQDVVEDVAYWEDENYTENHYAVVLYDGQQVTEGELQVGMVIQIYHGDELYGEYTIEELHTSIYS